MSGSSIERRHWALAVLFAAFLHALPWMLLRPALVRATPAAPRAPALAYLPIDTTGRALSPEDDPRAVWSPVLFSLPSPVGFSRSLLSGNAGIGAPVEGLDMGRLSLRREAPPPPPLVPGRVVLPFAEVRLSSPRKPASLPASPALEVLAILDDGSGDEPEQRPLPDPAMLGGLAWETDAEVGTDERGQVVRVLLNPPPPAQDARSLSLALHRWRFPPGAPRNRVIQLAYRGALPARVEASAAGGGARP